MLIMNFSFTTLFTLHFLYTYNNTLMPIRKLPLLYYLITIYIVDDWCIHIRSQLTDAYCHYISPIYFDTHRHFFATVRVYNSKILNFERSNSSKCLNHYHSLLKIYYFIIYLFCHNDKGVLSLTRGEGWRQLIASLIDSILISLSVFYINKWW